MSFKSLVDSEKILSNAGNNSNSVEPEVLEDASATEKVNTATCDLSRVASVKNSAMNTQLLATGVGEVSSVDQTSAQEDILNAKETAASAGGSAQESVSTATSGAVESQREGVGPAQAQSAEGATSALMGASSSVTEASAATEKLIGAEAAESQASTSAAESAIAGAQKQLESAAEQAASHLASIKNQAGSLIAFSSPPSSFISGIDIPDANMPEFPNQASFPDSPGAATVSDTGSLLGEMQSELTGAISGVVAAALAFAPGVPVIVQIPEVPMTVQPPLQVGVPVAEVEIATEIPENPDTPSLV